MFHLCYGHQTEEKLAFGKLRRQAACFEANMRPILLRQDVFHESEGNCPSQRDVCFLDFL